MANNDDPFGLSGDAGRTRIRPARARPDDAPAIQPAPAPGHGVMPVQMPAPSPAPRDDRPPPRGTRPHPNPLVTAFAPLLEIAPELERAAAPERPETLRLRLMGTLIDARDAAVVLGIAPGRANQAAWFVAALLDDIALNTPWGGHSDWPRQPLVVGLSGDVDAGTRFFKHLGDLLRHPAGDPALLELAYLCLGLGFRGLHRVEGAAGEAALTALREQIARQLRQPDAQVAPLSPHWQGVDAPDQRRRFAVPLWSVALVAVGLISAIHVALSVQLANRAIPLFAAADHLPPPEQAAIFRPLRDNAAPAETTPQLTLEPVTLNLLPLFQAAAPAPTRDALTGREDVSLTVLSVRGADPELFRSARAEVNGEYLPLIRAIADTIIQNAEVIGRVTVIGYTDSVPVQSSNPFQSNQRLSEARASAITALLAEAGVPADLLASEGRAERDPVGDNATREGRAQNRRIEIRIEKRL